MEQLHTPEGLAALLGVPKATVYQWNSKGTGPARTKVGRHVRYRQVDVDAWLDEQRAGYRPHTAEPPAVVAGDAASRRVAAVRIRDSQRSQGSQPASGRESRRHAV